MTVDVLPGLSLDAVIQEVEIMIQRRAGEATRVTRPRIGDIGAGGRLPDTVRLMDALSRLGALERR